MISRYFLSFIISFSMCFNAFSKDTDNIWWLDRLNNFASGSHFIAKQYNPNWHLPSLAALQSGYNLIKNSYLVSQGEKELSLTLATGAVINATQIGGYLTGYAVPGLSAVSFMYTAYNTYPVVLNAVDSYLYKTIKVNAKDPFLKIEEFNHNQKSDLVNSTYLSCSLLSHNKKSFESSLFVEEKDMPDLNNITPPQYFNKHVIVYGRWLEITTKSTNSQSKNYFFATLESPAKLQEACLRVYEPYFTKILNNYAAKPQDIQALNEYLDHEFIFKDPNAVNNNLIPTAGNTKNNNNYPFLFYIKVGDKAVRLEGKSS